MSKFQDLVNRIEPGIHVIFAKDGKIAMPTWFLEPENDKVPPMIIGTVIDSNINKDKVIHLIKEEFKKNNIARYLVIMEMWFASYEEKSKVGHLAPSKRRDRKEGILISGEDRDTGETIFKILRIDRTGPTPTLIPDDQSLSPHVEGRFANMFDRSRTKH
jgi:hypothetical protein